MISYEPLRHTLFKRELKITNVCRELGISSRTRTKFNKDESVSLATISALCVYLDVPIERVVEIKREYLSPESS